MSDDLGWRLWEYFQVGDVLLFPTANMQSGQFGGGAPFLVSSGYDKVCP